VAKICLIDPKTGNVELVDKAEEDIPALCHEWCGGMTDHFVMRAGPSRYITGFVHEHSLFAEDPAFFAVDGHDEILAGKAVLVASEGPATVDWPWSLETTKEHIQFPVLVRTGPTGPDGIYEGMFMTPPTKSKH